MKKITVEMSKLPELYVEYVVLGRGSGAELAKQINISPGRLSQLIHRPEIAAEIERISGKKLFDNPKLMDTSKEIAHLYASFMNRMRTAFETNDEDTILKYSKPIIELLKTKGMLERAGIVQNFIKVEQMTTEQLQVAIKLYVGELAKIILEFVTDDKKSACATKIDNYLENIGARVIKTVELGGQ